MKNERSNNIGERWQLKIITANVFGLKAVAYNKYCLITRLMAIAF